MNVADLHPRRHDPPAAWDASTFEMVTDALAAALVAAYRRGIAVHEDEGGAVVAR